MRDDRERVQACSRRWLPVLFVAVLGMATTASSAVLSQVIDNGLFTTDMSTELDWLDVTETQGLSRVEVEALVAPGGALDGWRFATTEQLSQLLHHFGVPPAGLGFELYPYFEEDYGSVDLGIIETVIDTLGDTFEHWAVSTGSCIQVPPGGAGYTWGRADIEEAYLGNLPIISDQEVIDCFGNPVDIDDEVNTFNFDHDPDPAFADPRIGHFLIRGPLQVPEICDNGIDDDLDGKIDLDDEECVARVGLRVRCLHDPIYAEEGDTVTIYAETLDSNGDPVVADGIEIFVDDGSAPVAQAVGVDSLTYSFNPSLAFSYACRAERAASPFPEEATSWSVEFDDPQLRVSLMGPQVGPPAVPGVLPVYLTGTFGERIDIVFFADDDEYGGPFDTDFLDHVRDLIWDGYFTVPWFVSFQWAFNFWIATDHTANASPKDPNDPDEFCHRDEPDKFKKQFSFADSGAIVHKSACRDNAGKPGLFTIWATNALRLQVVAHETGHRPFGLADEYPGAFTFGGKKKLFSSEYDPPHPNVFKKENQCREAAGLWWNAGDCRPLFDKDGKTFWLGEPDFEAQEPNDRELQVRDLMQQTGAVVVPGGDTLDRYAVGNSERARMGWFLTQCRQGRC